MKKELPKLKTSPLDDLFSTEEQRTNSNLERIVKIPINEIHDFKEHPFHVRMDEDMVKLIDSVQENGVLVPVLVRPDTNGNGYEMIAGHRRKFALSQVGIDTIDAIVRDLDDDQATILMVDSNIQRENILPSERGKAYKMRLEAMNHQGRRTDLTCSQVGNKLKYKKSMDTLAEQLGASRNQIHRFVRLTELNQKLQDMVDGVREDGVKMAFNPAVELSYLTEGEQRGLVEVIEDLQCTPSLAQAQELKRRSQRGVLSKEYMYGMLESQKANQKEKITLMSEDIDKYFPRSYTPKQKQDQIIKLLENWSKNRTREQSR